MGHEYPVTPPTAAVSRGFPSTVDFDWGGQGEGGGGGGFWVTTPMDHGFVGNVGEAEDY